MIIIPVIDENDSLTEITLDGVVFFLHLAWNSEGEFWSIGIENANKVTLIDAIALVPDYPIFERFRTPDMPAGTILAIAPDRRDTISYDDLVNGAVSLIYLEATD